MKFHVILKEIFICSYYMLNPIEFPSYFPIFFWEFHYPQSNKTGISLIKSYGGKNVARTRDILIKMLSK